MPALDTVANWATIILATVAIGYTLNNYFLYWYYGAKGSLFHKWPLEFKITDPVFSMARMPGGIPSTIRIISQIQAAPFPMAWNPRSPIKIESFQMKFGKYDFNVNVPSPWQEVAMERRTPTTKFDGTMNVSEFRPDEIADLLEVRSATLIATVTQTPRSIRKCKISFNFEMPVAIEGRTTPQIIADLRKQASESVATPDTK